MKHSSRKPAFKSNSLPALFQTDAFSPRTHFNCQSGRCCHVDRFQLCFSLSFVTLYRIPTNAVPSFNLDLDSIQIYGWIRTESFMHQPTMKEIFQLEIALGDLTLLDHYWSWRCPQSTFQANQRDCFICCALSNCWLDKLLHEAHP